MQNEKYNKGFFFKKTTTIIYNLFEIVVNIGNIIRFFSYQEFLPVVFSYLFRKIFIKPLPIFPKKTFSTYIM
jgi:hypothetical protein